MEVNTNPSASIDPGLYCLVTLLRFTGIGADPVQILGRLGSSAVGVADMLRCAKDLGVKARTYKTNWERLVTTPLPGVAVLRDGTFLLLGKIGDGGAIVQSPADPRPRMMTRAELEAVWDGQIILMKRRAGLSDLSRRFDVSWFLGAIYKYRDMLGRVLLAPFFLQLFALISPLLFQVVIDKVLVHDTIGTLDVLIIGLMTTRGRIGSSFDEFLKEDGIYEEVTARAIKRVIAAQLDAIMANEGLTKSELAKRMKTSRAQLNRVLDPGNESVTLGTLTRAAHAVGRTLKMELA